MSTRALTATMVAVASSVVFVVVAAGTLVAAGGGAGLCGSVVMSGILPPPNVPAVRATATADGAGPARAAAVVAGVMGDVGGCGGSGAVLERAAGWLTVWDGGPVPYESSSDPSTWFGGYRRDCSGYASMALGLPGPGFDTTALAAGSVPVEKADLRSGDLLINPATGPAGHVVVFDRWVDPSMSSYLGYEQAGDGGTHHRVIPYPYFGGYPMNPYRHAATGNASSTRVASTTTTP